MTTFDCRVAWDEEDEMYSESVWPNRPAQSGNLKGADESARGDTSPVNGLSGHRVSQRAPNGA